MTQQILDVPAIPLRDYVIFPSVLVPIYIGRSKSLEALKQFFTGIPYIFCINQKEMEIESPLRDDLCSIGTLVRIRQFLELKDGSYKVLVEGVKRARLLNWTESDNRYSATVEDLEGEFFSLSSHDQALLKALKARVKDFSEKTKLFSREMVEFLSKIQYPDVLCDFLAHHLPLRVVLKQEILDALDRTTRVEKTIVFLEKEAEWLRVEQRINARIKEKITEDQERYYKNQKLKAIQQELQDTNSEDDQSMAEHHGFLKRIKMLKLPKESEEKVLSELNKFKFMPAMSSEASVVRAYLEWVISLPWSKRANVSLNIPKAQERLDKDHFGLEKVKERIIEFLAVQKRMDKIKGPILCLVGPPGVGKTSLGKSIAKATNRQFVRMSLGGVRDEAEVRGHRRTYIGSLPGKIIQMMKKAGTKNPLFLLDEIDKVGNDYRGDPSSALLEALDPEQNTTFNDHYLEVDYDLSDVMFVTTANTLNILPPLLDRMEVIRIPGYTEDEKINIANKYLLPKQIKDNGVKEGEMKLADDTIKEIIRSYTRESGVRNLEREISKVTRKVVKKVVNNEEKSVEVNQKNIPDFLGIKKFKFGELEAKDKVGIVIGLAWTEFGGEILKVETVNMPGKGRMQITGKLGDVMQESVKAAKSYVRSKCLEFGVTPPLFEKKDFHIHVPEGATPKDGPSAGIAMVTSIVSSITKVPVKKEIAMTGEVTITGQVLPIGGLKEKLLAAHRAGVKKVLIPKENEKDLVDVPKKVKDDIEIVPVETADEVIKIALTKELKPTEWTEVDKLTETKKDDKSQASIQ